MPKSNFLLVVLLGLLGLLGMLLYANLIFDADVLKTDCQKVEETMAGYPDYNAVVSCDSYAKTVVVTEHEDYKEITLTTRNGNGHESTVKFLLLPDFSYHLK